MSPDRAGPRDAAVEGVLAPFVLGAPLLYLLTYRSWQPDFLIYSTPLLMVIVGYCIFLLVVLASYRRSLHPWLARIRRMAMLVGFWLLLWALGSEGILRLVSDYPRHDQVPLHTLIADPELGYRFSPNHEQQVVGIEWTTSFRTNSMGLRADREYGSGADDTIRIAGLGDSFTLGASVELEDTWTSVLERRLNEQSSVAEGFQVINAGHPGWGTVQQATWFARDGVTLEPDVVRFFEPPGAFTVRDGYLVNRFAAEGPAAAYREHRQRWFSLPGMIDRSELMRRLRVMLVRDAPTGPTWEVELSEDARLLHERTERYLLDLRDTAAGAGARLGIVLLTFGEQLTTMGPGHAPEAFGRRWTQWGSEHGIPVVDMYPAVSALADPSSIFWRWDYHYNARGNELIADAAMSLLADSLLLEGP